MTKPLARDLVAGVVAFAFAPLAFFGGETLCRATGICSAWAAMAIFGFAAGLCTAAIAPRGGFIGAIVITGVFC